MVLNTCTSADMFCNQSSLIGRTVICHQADQNDVNLAKDVRLQGQELPVLVKLADSERLR